MPIRGVMRIFFAEKPSSPIHRLEVGEVRSTPLSRFLVMPKASARRPGPEVSLGRSRGPCSVILRARAMASMPSRGSRARKRTDPALPSRSQETFRQ